MVYILKSNPNTYCNKIMNIISYFKVSINTVRMLKWPIENQGSVSYTTRYTISWNRLESVPGELLFLWSLSSPAQLPTAYCSQRYRRAQLLVNIHEPDHIRLDSPAPSPPRWILAATPYNHQLASIPGGEKKILRRRWLSIMDFLFKDHV